MSAPLPLFSRCRTSWGMHVLLDHRRAFKQKFEKRNTFYVLTIPPNYKNDEELHITQRKSSRIHTKLLLEDWFRIHLPHPAHMLIQIQLWKSLSCEAAIKTSLGNHSRGFTRQEIKKRSDRSEWKQMELKESYILYTGGRSSRTDCRGCWWRFPERK